MSMLTASARNALKTGDFALPKERAYPIHDEAHAKDALSRVAQNGTPDEQAKVKAAVRKRYPKIGNGGRQMSPNEAPGKTMDTPTVDVSDHKMKKARTVD